MGSGTRPETIEGDWNRFYLEFPDVYDRFAANTGQTVAAVHKMFGFAGKVLLDVGSGTGRSTFELAKHARFVVGLEPWAPMRAFAVERLRSLRLRNVAFVRGAVEHMPFAPHSADLIVSFAGFPFWFVDAGERGRRLGEQFLADCDRIVRPGGSVVAVGGAPGWEMGEPTPVLQSGPGEAERVHERINGRVHAYMTALGFAHRDVFVEGDYGSVREAVETYGFIYGRRAIDYLLTNNQHSVRWKLRIHDRPVHSQ